MLAIAPPNTQKKFGFLIHADSTHRDIFLSGNATPAVAESASIPLSYTLRIAAVWGESAVSDWTHIEELATIGRSHLEAA